MTSPSPVGTAGPRHRPDVDVQLVRNVWTRGGITARVRAVKYMWALFACNDLLFRRFGVGESGSCSHCAGRVENAWHVLGTCDDPQAAPLRRRWVDRMWAEVRKEVCRSRQALDIQVANAVCRLWTLEERGNYLRSWAVGSAEAVAGHGLDGRMAELLEGIAKAGSWATWMGVFQPGWIALLREGGMGHSRARRLTTRLSRVISECRADIARMRNERVRAEREVGREERARQLLAAVEALHARDDGSAYTLDQLRAAPRGEQERYRRRRERVERQEMERQRSEAEERLRVHNTTSDPHAGERPCDWLRALRARSTHTRPHLPTHQPPQHRLTVRLNATCELPASS